MGTRAPKIIEQVKESFLTLCQQYEATGLLLAALAGCEDKDQHLEVMKRILAQHREAGEQMTTLGTAIDLLGGRPVFKPQEGMRVISGTPKELKQMGIDVPKQKPKFTPGFQG